MNANTAMITAYQFGKIQKELARAERVAKEEMPKGQFVFVGVDATYIYFNVVARLSETNDQEIRDIKAKTRFEPLSETTDPHYKGIFRMFVM